MGLPRTERKTGNMDSERTLACSPGGQVGTLRDAATVRNMNARRAEVRAMFDN
jgi:hypothetical protein